MHIQRYLALSIKGIIFALLPALAYCQPQKAQKFHPELSREFIEPAQLNQTNITLTVGEVNGTIKTLLGVNAGPLPSGDKGNSDLTTQYQTHGVNMVRTHDFYGPFDMAIIYPDINADPENPLSYNFADSDRAFESIIKAGAQPYIRIGDSWNDVRVPHNEKEMENLVRASCQMIRHYLTYKNKKSSEPFKYVEIGNEPDFNRLWPTGFESFLPFFARTFNALKRQFPQLKIGGPGFVFASYKIPKQHKNISLFLDFLKQKNIKPDFISFHIYSNNPAEYYDSVLFYRDACQKAGFYEVELHITEWNTEGKGKDLDFRLGDKAAPYITAIWIALQEAGLDVSLLYRGTDTSIENPGFPGIFFADGREKPAAKAFKLWCKFSKASRRRAVTTGISLLDSEPVLNMSPKPLWVIAGEMPPKTIMLLLANIGNQKINYNIRLPGNALAESIEVTEIQPPDARVISYKTDKQQLSIDALTVQLLNVELIPN